jgi:WD40 repeat protein
VNETANDNTNDNENSNGNDNGTVDGPCQGRFMLSVNVITPGAGTLTLDPPGECYTAGTRVLISAQANDTYTFLGYSGDANGSSVTTSVILDEDKSITATFTGNCFVAGEGVVLQFDAVDGELVSEFVTAGSGGLDTVTGLVFGPDRDLYVSSNAGILRYNGTSGSFVSVFVQEGENGLNSPFGLAFDASGNLYVADGNTVLRYDSSGEFFGAFVSAGVGGLTGATGLRFGPNGNLFVANGDLQGSVLEYSSTTGAFVGGFVEEGSNGLGVSFDLTFGPDGDLYVSAPLDVAVTRYDSQTGDPTTCPCLCVNPCPDPSITLEEEYRIGSAEGLSGFPAGVAFGPDGNLLVAGNSRVFEFAVPAAGPLDGTTFAADERIGPFAFITIKPLP